MTTLKRIWNIASTTVLVFIIFCAVLLMGSRFIGYAFIPGSMEPGYSGGDLLCVKEVDLGQIKVDDLIAVALNEDTVVTTLRVVKMDTEKQCFYTSGDANDKETLDPVDFNNVIGIPQFSVPKLGYIADFVQDAPGIYILIGVGLIVIFLIFTPDRMGKKNEEETDKTSVAQIEVDITTDENAGHLSSGELAQLHAAKENEKTE